MKVYDNLWEKCGGEWIVIDWLREVLSFVLLLWYVNDWFNLSGLVYIVGFLFLFLSIWVGVYNFLDIYIKFMFGFKFFL